MRFLVLFLSLLCASSSAFAPPRAFTGRLVTLERSKMESTETPQAGLVGRRDNKANLMEAAMFIGPSSAFVVGIVAAFIAYIGANFEEIKAKQKVATDAAMAEQSKNINSAMSKQAAAIKEAKESQERAIAQARKAAEEARKR